MTGMNDEGRQWYVVNTYSGHENKVKENLEKRVESMGLQDILFQIVIPEHVETEIKDGKKINKTKNMFPGYVLVEMIMTDEAWYVVRNTSGVTGFIGSSGGGAKPFPLQKSELDPDVYKRQEGISAILDHYKIKVEETMAFGDGHNDIDMLQFVGTGICMENGCAETKAVCDYITDNVDNDGIVSALRYFGLL